MSRSNGNRPAPAVSRAVDSTKQAVLDLILERGLQPGDVLPREADLAASVGVARNTLREAMKTLQALGIVEIQHGLGTFVGTTMVNPLVAGLSFRGRLSLKGDCADALELVDVRETLEAGLMDRVVALARPDDIDRVRQIVEQMEASAARDEGVAHLDARFHEAMFLPLGNRVLSELLRAFWEVYAAVAHDLRDEKEIDLAHTAADHRLILEAVAARDSHRAADAVRSHFVGIRERLRGLDAEP